MTNTQNSSLVNETEQHIEVKAYSFPVAIVTLIMILGLFIGGIVGVVKAWFWLEDYRNGETTTQVSISHEEEN